MDYFHLLNVNKPRGLTSRDVVNRVQRLIRPAKAGHAGTLDPLASGVLVLCLGPATRLIEYVQGMKKHYTGTFLLGRRSDTEDIEGSVEELPDPRRPMLHEIEAAARQMQGDCMQRPPAFSALRVQGRRAYELARKGLEVQLEPRPIHVYALRVVDYAYPELTLDIECSSGTYVRSLGRDLAESLGTNAVMSALSRTAIGSFRLDEACEIDQLTKDTLSQYLLPPTAALASVPRVTIDESQWRLLASGQPIVIATVDSVPHEREVAAVLSSGQLVGIICPRADGHWWPLRNFVTAQ